MNEGKLDALLIETMNETLGELPDEIVAQVTPFHTAIRSMLCGLGLTAITLNFLCLQYLLPAIGILLLILGSRKLRGENPWFFSCYLLSVLRGVLFYPTLVLNATVYQTAFYQCDLAHILSGMQIMTVFALIFCFYKALRQVQKECGIEMHAGAAIGLMLWYLAVCLLAIFGYSGLLLGIPMILCYLLMLRCLFKLSKELTEAGYAIRPSKVRCTDGLLSGILALLLSVGILIGYLCFGSYPMQWKSLSENEHASVEDICIHLTDLGFPKEILSDLAVEDILPLQDAKRVIITTRDHPVNDGREVVEVIGNTTHHTTVYDQNELRLTQIAVELGGSPERWQLIHHFEWIIPPKFCGTEAIQLWTTDRLEGWLIEDSVSGRLLYDQNDRTYTADYYTSGIEGYRYNSLFTSFFGNQQKSDWFAAFSLPNSGERQRGYLSYGIIERTDGCIIDSWINYVHQKNPWQYPVYTAVEHRKTRSGLDDRVFHLTQDALQLTPYGGEYHPFE